MEEMLKTQIKEQKRLANQQASVHAGYARELELWETAVSVPSLLLSVLLLAIIFLDPARARTLLGMGETAYLLTTALLSILNFMGVVVLLFFKPRELAQRHRAAVTHYTAMKYAAKKLLESESTSFQDLHDLRERYLDNAALPSIPDGRFNRLKQAHLVKVEISKELTRNPHRSIREIQRNLRAKKPET